MLPSVTGNELTTLEVITNSGPPPQPVRPPSHFEYGIKERMKVKTFTATFHSKFAFLSRFLFLHVVVVGGIMLILFLSLLSNLA